MVFLRHPLLGPTERLDLRSTLDGDGPCLIIEHPGGKRWVHRFVDDAALTRGTEEIHAELLRDGWETRGPGVDPYLR